MIPRFDTVALLILHMWTLILQTFWTFWNFPTFKRQASMGGKLDGHWKDNFLFFPPAMGNSRCLKTNQTN